MYNCSLIDTQDSMYNCSLIHTQDREVVLLTLPYVFENLLEEIVILVCKLTKM